MRDEKQANNVDGEESDTICPNKEDKVEINESSNMGKSLRGSISVGLTWTPPVP